jgi:hypothetical protein
MRWCADDSFKKLYKVDTCEQAIQQIQNWTSIDLLDHRSGDHLVDHWLYGARRIELRIALYGFVEPKRHRRHAAQLPGKHNSG